MRSLCDSCLAYQNIYKVVEAEQKFCDQTKHLCSDCFFKAQKKAAILRSERRDRRDKQTFRKVVNPNALPRKRY